MVSRFKDAWHELKGHLPYTIFSVAAGLIIVGLLTVLIVPATFSTQAQKLFHLFHPIHVLLSATATTAMFWRHDKKIFKAILVGFIGAVGLCGISDIFLPFVAGHLLGIKMQLHICPVEHYALILPFVLLGIFTGLLVSTMSQSTFLSHAAHVFVSSMASILYLVSFGLTNWIAMAGMVLIYMVLAVMIPCCTSDIIFPLFLAEKK